MAAGLAGLMLTSGCSLLVVDGPPPAELRPDIEFVCTTSPLVPLLDVLAMGAAGFRAAQDTSADDRDFAGATLSRNHDLLLSFGVLAGFAASAAVGYTRVQACDEATAAKARQRLLDRQHTAGGSAAPPSAAPGAT